MYHNLQNDIQNGIIKVKPKETNIMENVFNPLVFIIKMIASSDNSYKDCLSSTS